MSKKIKHPVVTITLSVVCRADEKQEVLDSMTEWYFSEYTPSLQVTGKPKVSKRREASKKQKEYFWDGLEDEDGEEENR